MSKPLQQRKMSAVTISVSCLPVSGSAAEQVSLETELKQLQRLKTPDLFWQPVPVVQTWQKSILRNLFQSGQQHG